MRSLHSLIHSLAKEEKRLYNLHGRDARFTSIYEGYLQASEYDKTLDREIFKKHFSTFSRAFYSMQKNALLDDLLSVLLEYSNSSKPEFAMSRLRSKYEVLVHKGFLDLASNYLKDAVKQAQASGDHKEYSRILEDYLRVLSQLESTSWEEYEQLALELEKTQNDLERTHPAEFLTMQLKVLIQSARNNPSEAETYKKTAQHILYKIQEIDSDYSGTILRREAFKATYNYSRAFEDKFDLHKRMVNYEKELNTIDFPAEFRLQVVNLLLESSLDVGDFLLMNGLIYKTDKDLTRYSPGSVNAKLPDYLEYCGIYHFYENDLPQSQQEFNRLLELKNLKDETRIRIFYHLASVQIAANLARSARGTLRRLEEAFPDEAKEPWFQMLRVVVAVEMNDVDEADLRIQRFRTEIRKAPNPRKLSSFRNFLDQAEKLNNKSNAQASAISALERDWKVLFRPNAWLLAKTTNAFYYNQILAYWQSRKKVIHV